MLAFTSGNNNGLVSCLAPLQVKVLARYSSCNVRAFGSGRLHSLMFTLTPLPLLHLSRSNNCRGRWGKETPLYHPLLSYFHLNRVWNCRFENVFILTFAWKSPCSAANKSVNYDIILSSAGTSSSASITSLINILSSNGTVFIYAPQSQPPTAICIFLSMEEYVMTCRSRTPWPTATWLCQFSCCCFRASLCSALRISCTFVLISNEHLS